MKVLVIDGQGGNIGKMVVELLKSAPIQCDIIALGTNSIATSAMMRGGNCPGATGENAIVVNCKSADYIIGPIGILAADSLLGELTPAMAVAIGQSTAQKILIPLTRCSNMVVGVGNLSRQELVQQAVQTVVMLEGEKS